MDGFRDHSKPLEGMNSFSSALSSCEDTQIEPSMRNGTLTRYQICQHLDLGLPSFQKYDKMKFLLLKLCVLWYFATAAQTNTAAVITTHTEWLKYSLSSGGGGLRSRCGQNSFSLRVGGQESVPCLSLASGLISILWHSWTCRSIALIPALIFTWGSVSPCV